MKKYAFYNCVIVEIENRFISSAIYIFRHPVTTTAYEIFLNYFVEGIKNTGNIVLFIRIYLLVLFHKHIYTYMVIFFLSVFSSRTCNRSLISLGAFVKLIYPGADKVSNKTPIAFSIDTIKDAKQWDLE